MEWLIWVPIVAFALLCPLMMIGMIVGGWIMARRATAGHGGSDHSGHGMMCMMHGLFQKKQDHPEPSGVSVGELKAERERLDKLIARAESEFEGEPVAAGSRSSRDGPEWP